MSIKGRDLDIKMLDHWINYHLNNRYAIRKGLTLDDNKKFVDAIDIGIEDPKELTMLSLGCSLLHKI
jgi:hypothetical protein